MSINGGFATAVLERTYNTLVYNLIYLLQYRIKRLYNADVVSEKNFQKVLGKTFNKIKRMETDKHSSPKFSEAMKDLADLLTQDDSLANDSNPNCTGNSTEKELIRIIS
jgi:hypothetical protein